MKATATKRKVYEADKTSRTTLEYKFLNDIEYGKHYYSWIECNEFKAYLNEEKSTNQRFVYITNIPQTTENVVSSADSGRLRWKIENEGFNAQKNLGYDLEHKFSRVSYMAMPNYYRLCQIAHAVNQFVEQSMQVIELLREHSRQTLVDLWKKLLAYLTMVYDPVVTIIEPG